FFFFSSRRRHTRSKRDWSSDVCSSDLCAPGKADDYLDAVAREWVPVAEQRGLTLAGAWRTAMRDTEAVLLWCLPTLADFTRHLRSEERRVGKEGRVRWSPDG